MSLNHFFSQLEKRSRDYWSPPSWWNMLVVLPFVVGIVFSLYGWRADRVAAAREQTAHGQIVSHQPYEHDRFGYTYSVNGRAYSGWAYPSSHDYAVGQRVMVYYDPVDPRMSSLNDFADDAWAAFRPVPLFVSIVIVVAVLIFFRRGATAGRRIAPG